MAPSVDSDRSRSLDKVEGYVGDLRTLALVEEIRRDLRERRFVEWTLQLAIGAMIDSASHIVSQERLGEPHTPRDLIDRMARGGWLPSSLASRLGAMVDLRATLLYDYESVDLAIVEDVVRNHLDDLLEFVRAVRGRL